MSHGQNNPNQGNQKGGRDDQKHTQKQRDQLANDTKVDQQRQDLNHGKGAPASVSQSGKTNK